MADRGSLDAILRGAADMASFGFGDEISAGVRSGFGLRGNYGQELDAVRARNAEAQQQHPWAYGAGEVAGLAPMMAIPGMGIARGATLAGRVGRGALAGATIGGMQGAGSADGNLADRAMGAASGSVIGAGLGAAAPIAGRVVGQAAGRASNRGIMSPRMVNDEVAYAYQRGEALASAGDIKGAAASMKLGRSYLTRQIKSDAINAAYQRAGTHPEGVGRGLEVEFRKLLKSKALPWTGDERAALAKVMHGGEGPNARSRVSAASKTAWNGGARPFHPETARDTDIAGQFSLLTAGRMATPSLAQFASRFAGEDNPPRTLASLGTR